MTLRSFALLLMILSAPVYALAHRPQTAVPADPKASDGARNVLNYLANLPNQDRKRVVSGQMVFSGGKSDFPDWWNDVVEQTGSAPGLMHADIRCTGNCSIGAMPPEVLAKLIDHWRAGGLVMVSAHHSNPLTGGSSKDTKFSEKDFARLLNSGDPVHAAYFEELDLIARQLKNLEEARVVVLYRPLLEMNGDWYWWSKGTTVQYVRLWRMEFDYLTRTKGLHDLLFVWSPNSELGHYADYYPGNAYVDITALDFYRTINGGPIAKFEGYDELTREVARSKPFGIAEFGPLDPTARSFTAEDYYQLIVDIRQNMPRTTFWSSHWTIWSMGLADPPSGRHLNVPKLLADPWVVNEGNIDFSGSSASPVAAPTQH